MKILNSKDWSEVVKKSKDLILSEEEAAALVVLEQYFGAEGVGRTKVYITDKHKLLKAMVEFKNQNISEINNNKF